MFVGGCKKGRARLGIVNLYLSASFQEKSWLICAGSGSRFPSFF